MACRMGEESYLYRYLQHTSDRSRNKLSCMTVLLREHTMLLFQSTKVILIPLEFINFNRNGIQYETY